MPGTQEKPSPTASLPFLAPRNHTDSRKGMQGNPRTGPLPVGDSGSTRTPLAQRACRVQTPHPPIERCCERLAIRIANPQPPNVRLAQNSNSPGQTRRGSAHEYAPTPRGSVVICLPQPERAEDAQRVRSTQPLPILLCSGRYALLSPPLRLPPFPLSRSAG